MYLLNLLKALTYIVSFIGHLARKISFFEFLFTARERKN